ncbi:MAG TPA: ferredoxin reductase [Terriglobales bacterium]|nr:ferredoxin reductase [Terriglobales bacterium]
MARAAIQRRLTWTQAEVVDVLTETPRVRTLVLSIPDWSGHLAGQHVDVRLTAGDGYQAQRSYSISSAPEDAQLKLSVERLEDGEVSPYLADELRAGDQLELRGPIGGYFVWEASMTDPLLLVGGGSGVCPLMAMLRHRAARSSTVPAKLLYSARDLGDVIYRSELEHLGAGEGLEVVLTLTRSQPPGWTGYGRRVDNEMLAEVAWPPERRPLVYICGPTPFVEAVAGSLVALGHDPMRIRTERFGPTGG